MKSYKLQSTKHPNLFRLVDREGNWKRYAFVREFTDGYAKRLENEDEDRAPLFSELKDVVYLDGVTTILDLGYAKGAFFEKWIGQHSADEREEILKSAGEKGDMTHRTIDMLLSGGKQKEEIASVCCGTRVVDSLLVGGAPVCANCHLECEIKTNIIAEPMVLTRDTEIFNRETQTEEPLSNDIWDCLLSFSAFWNAHDPIVIMSEFSIYNVAFGYAGTSDALLILQKACGVRTCKCADLIGKIGLWDWKTSKGIRASYGAQTAAYALSENIAEYLPPDQQIAYTAILRIGTAHTSTGGYEMATFFAIPPEDDKAFKSQSLFGAWKRFLGAKDQGDYENRPFDPEKDILDIADEITIAAPHFDMAGARKEAERLAATPVEAKQVKPLKLNLSMLKVGVWIRDVHGDIAQVVQLDDDGIVHSVSNDQEGLSHYTKIQQIFASEEEAKGTGETDVDTQDIKPLAEHHAGKLVIPKAPKKKVTKKKKTT